MERKLKLIAQHLNNKDIRKTLNIQSFSYSNNELSIVTESETISISDSTIADSWVRKVIETNTLNLINKRLSDFAENCKFKTAKECNYSYFTVYGGKQIRIYKNNKTSQNALKYQVTLHPLDGDGITHKEYERNEPAMSLKDAKLIAAKYYFSVIENS